VAARYLPIRDYALIGDGRTVALVGRDGGIDWLCLPNMDAPSVFGALVDSGRGGSFELRPAVPFEASRRYRPGTNVLETTFSTDGGAVRVTDAMTLPARGLGPLREFVRRVEGLAGRVPMRWRVAPRFGYGQRRTRLEWRGAVPVATSGGDAVAVCAWDAGIPRVEADAVGGSFEAVPGRPAWLVLPTAHGEPLVLGGRDDVERRLDVTVEFWQRWSSALVYDGPWRDAVVRSALALKLLVFAPSGAIVAAPTTSLPEAIGGDRNWDYRFCWIRDSSFTLEALLQLGCHTEARSFFWWFMHASRLTHPRLQVFYRLDGGAYAPERALDLEGYAGSRPVRVGNGAAGQLQLDAFGNLLDAAFVYVERGYGLDRETGRYLAGFADFVCAHWREPDAGIWEVRMAPRHFTHSKAMCWVALDRAIRLAEAGHLPARRAPRWRREAAEIRAFIDERCWSARHESYVRSAGSDELDAALLMLAIMRYGDRHDPRLVATIEAVRRELGRDALVYRYTGEDGLPGGEGAFLSCSFWLAEALAMIGRPEESARTMEALLPLANDVGLYAEEIDPTTGDFLGNFPQGLVHLALVSAAAAFVEHRPR
jgi:GH15 family glucan-1,4-alpha-glucosidase